MNPFRCQFFKIQLLVLEGKHRLSGVKSLCSFASSCTVHHFYITVLVNRGTLLNCIDEAWIQLNIKGLLCQIFVADIFIGSTVLRGKVFKQQGEQLQLIFFESINNSIRTGIKGVGYENSSRA